jgi:spore coat polysaccharide biosynthesis protein SpsF
MRLSLSSADPPSILSASDEPSPMKTSSPASPKVVVIAQARMGSSRLPGKVLKVAGGDTLLAHLVRRVLQAHRPHLCVIATTRCVADDEIESAELPSAALIFRGDEHDVLNRYYEAARTVGADVIVRVTGDCPLLDPIELDRVIDVFLQSQQTSAPYDYVTNQAGTHRLIPRGLDVEVMTASALAQAAREATEPGEREHVTPYLYQRGLFHTRVTHPEGPDLSDLRLTVDTPEDLKVVRAIFDALGPAPTTSEVAKFLHKHPEILSINGHVKQRGTRSEHQRRQETVRGRWLVGRADRSFTQGSGHIARLSAVLAGWAHLGGRASMIGGGLDDFWSSYCTRVGVEVIPLEGDTPESLHIDFAQHIKGFKSKPAFILFDGYEFLEADVESARLIAPLGLIDDHASSSPHWYEAFELIINQNLGFPVERYPQTIQARCLVGAEYVLLRPEFWGTLDARDPSTPSSSLIEPTPDSPPTLSEHTLSEHTLSEHTLSEHTLSEHTLSEPVAVVITFGSSDPERVTAPLLQYLLSRMDSSSRRPPLKVEVVIGPAFDPQEVSKIQDMASGVSRVTLLENVIDLAQVFKRAELALSAGGTTTWELIRCGVTPYILRVADNQDVVSEGLETYQIGADLGIYRADSPRDWAELLAPVEEALISSHRARDRQRAQTLIDGRGVWRLIDRLLTLASSI